MSAPLLDDARALAQALVARTGVVLPALVLYVVYLALRYPERVPGTVSARSRPQVYQVPHTWPILGNTINVVRLGTAQQFERFLKLCQDAPNHVFRMTIFGPGSVMLLNRPEYIEYMQKTNFSNYDKGHQFRSRFGDLLGTTGIFVADGHVWRQQRKQASHMFSSKAFSTWIRSVVHNELDDVVGLLENLSAPGGAGKLCMTELFFRYTLSSFSKMAFSANLDCLSPDPASLEKPVPFAMAFDGAQGIINKRFVTPAWYFIERFSSDGRQMRHACRVIRDFGMGIISSRIAERNGDAKAPLVEKKVDELDAETTRKGANKKEGADLLGLFMDLTSDPEELLVVVMNFIIAGRDTTAQSLSWFFFELLANPQHLPIIRAELAEQFGAPEGGIRLEYEQVKTLPYTLACWSEAIRLHPAVPKNGKEVVADDVIIPQGPNPDNLPPIPVFKGEKVGWSDWVMNRLPAVWGEDAAEYNPLRFLERDAAGKWAYVQHSQWKYHVFNGGPRLCLGMNLANYEGLALIAATLPQFDFHWASKAEGQTAEWPLTYLNSVTHPSVPYVLKVTRREAAA